MALCLLDTNILLRVVNYADPEHELVLEAMTTLADKGHTLAVTPQVLIEFWAVATRPSVVNGFGWSPEVVALEITRIRSLFQVLPDSEDIFTNWLQLVSAYNVSGKQVHDTRLVAVAYTHNVEFLLTLNVRDFQRFPGIVALHPSDVPLLPNTSLSDQ